MVGGWCLPKFDWSTNKHIPTGEMIFCEILSIQRNVVNENLQISSLTGGEEKRGKGNEYCFVLHDWEFNLTGQWLE